ncbi:hypothetical protein B0J12DRAFT_702356 [Macrophomina phaseolina]|uniref:RING-type domain-containing protein n=1 Tax=Macrophomina phaseolina TaxID=35725 RepID=A0ABQ8G2D1_9PEZI|nr:hypothetical protein B0J12DRAFT_702356 [Macrophomina phaseolina]
MPSRTEYLESLQQQQLAPNLLGTGREDEAGKEIQCGICMELLTFSDHVVSACGHVKHTFHYQCLLDWLSGTDIYHAYISSCPICRKELYDRSYPPRRTREDQEHEERMRELEAMRRELEARAREREQEQYERENRVGRYHPREVARRRREEVRQREQYWRDQDMARWMERFGPRN